MATQKLSFFKFNPLKPVNLIEYAGKLQKTSNDKEKFVINDCTDFWLDGYYVIEYVKNESRYNFLETKIEIIPVTVTSIAKFCIDLKNNLMDIWGNKNIALKLITALSISMHNEVTIESISTDIKEAISLALLESNASVIKVKIEDIIIDNGIVANCSVNLSGQEDYKELLKKYIKNITQATLSVYDEEPENRISFTIYSSGSVVVYKDKDEIEDNAFEIIKKICFPNGRVK